MVVVRPDRVQTRIQDKASGDRLASYASTDYASPLDKFVGLSKRASERGYSPEALVVRVVDTVEAKRPESKGPFVRQTLRFWAIPELLPDRTYEVRD